MNPQEITLYFRLWVLMSLLVIIVLLLTDRIDVSAQMDKIAIACVADYNIDLNDFGDGVIEDIKKETPLN